MPFLCSLRKVSWGHPKQMPEPSQPAPLDEEEQRLYSELLPGERAPHPICKGAPCHPAEETHFGCLYPGSFSFSHDPKFMTIGAKSTHFTTTDRYNDCITAAAAPICLSISCSILPSLTLEQDPKILKLLRLRQELSPNPEGASHLFPVENHGLRLGGADSHNEQNR